jgi:phosphate transport system protein
MPLLLERQIEKLKRLLLQLGGMVEDNVMNAVTAVVDLDLAKAEAIIARDDVIDEKEVDVEEECLKVLALHQPVAIDLRFIAAVLRINRDLERIGDIAVNMAREAKALSEVVPPPKIPAEFASTASKARGMLKDSLDALVNLDMEVAHSVCERDPEIDELSLAMYDELVAYLGTQSDRLNPLARLLRLPRFVERLGDHARNIAEDVIYMVEGEIVRHNRM